MNFLELQQMVERNLGREDIREDIKNSINLGIQRIAYDLNGRIAELETHVVTSVPEDIRVFTLPKCLSIFRVALANGDTSELHRLTRPEYDEFFVRYLKDPKKGKPKYYTRSGRNLEIYPVPDQSYDIFVRYAAFPETLVKDDDIAPIHYDALVIAAATVKVFSLLTMPEEASYWHQIYQSELQTYKRVEKSIDGESNTVMRGFSTTENSISVREKVNLPHGI